MYQTQAEIKKNALIHADAIAQLDGDISRIDQYLQDVDIDPPKASTEQGYINRLIDSHWWERRLLIQQERQIERYHIDAGSVRKGQQIYCSNQCNQTIKTRVQKTRAFMATMEAVSNHGDTLDMTDIMQASLANPENRRAELMIRIAGFEHYADEHGHIGEFITLTAPSKYHRYSGHAINDKYDEGQITPKQTQKYLCAIWAKIRAKLKRDGINCYGFRVAEPHHDGTPHWHLLLFVRPDQHEAMQQIIRHYAFEADPNEPGALQHRVTFKTMDKTFGTASGYIAKYISKNIGFNVGPDDEDPGQKTGTTGERVRAWASMWGIRQFQQIGGASVTIWRELRRIEAAPDGILEQARQAADQADWSTFLEIMGGADVNRKDQPLSLLKKNDVNPDTGEMKTNKYQEIINRIVGVCALVHEVITRLKQWEIRFKTRTEQAESRSGLALGVL